MSARAELLAFRRRVVAAAQARRAPRRLPVALPPSGPLVAYTRALDALSADLDAAILDVLSAEGLVERADADGDASQVTISAARARSLTAKMERAIAAAIKRRPLLAKLEEIAQATGAHSREQWRKQVKAALGVDLPAAEPSFAKLYESFRKENTALIKSIATEKVDRVREILRDAGSGTRVEQIAKQIRESAEVTRSRARLIARDQVLKLNSEVTQERHKAAGVESYVWRTSRDERVREAHRALDGKTFRYDDPPVVDPRRGDRAHPGQHYRCRCIGEPIIPGFDA